MLIRKYLKCANVYKIKKNRKWNMNRLNAILMSGESIQVC